MIAAADQELFENNLDLEKLDTENRFYFELDQMVRLNEVSYMNCIIHWAENNAMELETCGQFINKNLALRAKLQIEAEQLNFVEKSRCFQSNNKEKRGNFPPLHVRLFAQVP